MKYLLRVLFVVALLCGGSSLAHADGIDFRMTVLDPPAEAVCNPAGVPAGSPGNTNCTIFTGGDISPVNVSQAACNGAGIGPSGLTPGTYGCFVVDNESGSTIDSIELGFLIASLVTTPSCDNGGQTGNQGNFIASALNVVSCAPDPSSPLDYALNFAGGAGVAPGNALIVFEQGENPNDFQGGSATIGVTPEPDSLLLFSTGVMMAGMYMSRRIWTTRKSAGETR
ncbi:hypothetical protein RBB77_05305 [Tunturibacter psychrotolerans]|uniref:PEP-CTERM sorting domain-containing protein n=1 Tax=Tunturiibacter psychrotolerans TaxID=3069686 RepID=A0AAU7ZTQ0_9BACT